MRSTLAVPLVFVPELSCFFLHGEPSALAPLAEGAARGSLALIGPGGVRARTRGVYLALDRTVAHLASLPVAHLDRLPGSIAAYALASKIALDLVARERVVPIFRPEGDALVASWGAALASPDDAAALASLAAALPPSAHALPIAPRSDEAWAPISLLRAFLDACVDSLVREGAPLRPGDDDRDEPRWEDRLVRALATRARRFRLQGFGERSVAAELSAWAEPLRGTSDRPRTCFRLELPEDGSRPFTLSFLLQMRDDPSALVTARDVFARAPSLAHLGRSLRDADELLLASLSRAARIFAPVGRALEDAAPVAATLDAQEAWRFLGEGGAALSDAGFGVILPAALTASGARRLRLRARIGAARATRGAVASAGLSLPELLHVEWEAALGDEALSARDLSALAAQKAPLVLHRGEWVLVDPRELADVHARLGKGARSATALPASAALAAVLGGEATIDGRAVPVVAGAALASVIDRLRTASTSGLAAPPASLRAELRPYQLRGLAWLSTMSALGLGACLADDMGLGKTIQLLAFLLAERERAPRDPRPSLLVAPTSVVGNWAREAARFAPSLEIVGHHGLERATSSDALASRAGALVITTYGVLRRDAELLSAIDWATVALDEAQNVKTAESSTARAARSLRAARRFALTGTPVENRLAELWSILEFATPGLLGSSESFRRRYAVPIERHGEPAAATRLRGIVAPFLLRRLKSDPTIIQDLPAKNEMKVVCTLTREQASLYQAVLDAELARIASADGISRRGRVLALLSFLKQVCNHPAQYLGEAVRDPAALAGRSGKLERLGEMLEEAISVGDRALVFTQFREMGERLERYLAAKLGVPIEFLHGGTRRAQRDEMVQRFQEDTGGARVLVLSVKAGGTGLNLTAASHVFHFDRWWNPAVEDQATDRAYRIGQRRAVQVHKLLTAGTLEEKIDAMLERKRDLAATIVGAGEQWITELGDRELRELFALSGEGASVGDEEATARAPRRPRRATREARP